MGMTRHHAIVRTERHAGRSQQGVDLVAQLDEHSRGCLAQALGGFDDVGSRALRNPQQWVVIVVRKLLHLRLRAPITGVNKLSKV